MKFHFNTKMENTKFRSLGVMYDIAMTRMLNSDKKMKNHKK